MTTRTDGRMTHQYSQTTRELTSSTLTSKVPMTHVKYSAAEPHNDVNDDDEYGTDQKRWGCEVNGHVIACSVLRSTAELSIFWMMDCHGVR